jgi:tetratricopeptide (TPR) repeat protein
MVKIGRNHPCPCGSSKKYKQCCLAKDEQVVRAAAPEPRQSGWVGDLQDDDLTEASNAVVDLIHAGDLAAAEDAAHELLKRFPEVHDGYDRLGMICEARGDNRQAAEYYRKVIAFLGEHPENDDPDLQATFRRRIERLDPPPVG